SLSRHLSLTPLRLSERMQSHKRFPTTRTVEAGFNRGRPFSNGTHCFMGKDPGCFSFFAPGSISSSLFALGHVSAPDGAALPLAGPPPADNNPVIVTRKPNIVDVFGKHWLDIREGEASVFEPDGHGRYKVDCLRSGERLESVCPALRIDAA